MPPMHGPGVPDEIPPTLTLVSRPAGESGDGFAVALSAAIADGTRRDVGIVLTPCELPPGALARVRAAAHADDTIGAACALSVGGHTPMFPGRDGDPVLVADGPARITELAGGSPIHPRTFTLRGPCVVVRRSTLELLGDLGALLPGAVTPEQWLAALAERIVGIGLSCALADDVLARARPRPSAVDPREPHEGWEQAARELDDALELGPLRRSLVAARTFGRRLSVTIDGRGLGAGASGTQAYVSGLVLALAGSERVDAHVVVRAEAPEPLLAQFRAAGARVARLGEGDAPPAGWRRTDIAHRPQQAFVPEDLRLLRELGERIVISHLDLISYRTPSYHESPVEWVRYRALTRLALSAADAVVFFSEHARADALAEDLVEPERTSLAGLGMDGPELGGSGSGKAQRPAALGPDVPLLVAIGADYRHKNRSFALRLLDRLIGDHGWPGRLVLAGGHVPYGSSAAEEAELLASSPVLAKRTHDLGPIPESQKRWLLSHATALLAPSLYEGFGLVPLEAAHAGIPCLYAPVTSMIEVVGAELATIVPWDPGVSAAASLALLEPGRQRERHVAELREQLRRWRWAEVVDRLLASYEQAIHRPYRTSAPRAWSELEREELIVALDRRRADVEERVGFALPLVDRDGLLTREQQRGLMRIASRPWLRTALLGPVGMLGSVPAAPDQPTTDSTA